MMVRPFQPSGSSSRRRACAALQWCGWGDGGVPGAAGEVAGAVGVDADLGAVEREAAVGEPVVADAVEGFPWVPGAAVADLGGLAPVAGGRGPGSVGAGHRRGAEAVRVLVAGV